MALKLLPCDSGGTEDTSRTPVPIGNDADPVHLGRNPLTGIIDKKLSRQQVEIAADFQNRRVTVKQLGSHSGAIDGESLEKGESRTVKDGGIFHLLKGKYAYKVSFSEQNNNKKSGHGKEVDISEETMPKADKNIPDSTLGKRKASEMEEEASDRLVQDAPQKKAKTDNKKDEKLSVKELSVEEKLKALQENARAEMADPSRGAKDGRLERERSVAQGGIKTGGVQHGAVSSEEQWGEHGKLVVYTAKGVRASSKIAGFDLDGTIITTNSGKVFPVDLNDWRIYLSQIPGRLKKLLADGFKIVFFTNQLGISKGKMTIADFKKKLMKILAKLAIPVQVLIATGQGIYRKPCLGMWDHFLENMNDDIMVDFKESIFVGDAAGRPADWEPKRKKDFSCSDRLFAMNIGLTFKTPEEFFQGTKAVRFTLPSFDPRKISTHQLLDPPVELPCKSQEVLVLVGFPASGKSTFVKKHLLPHKYVHVNRDTMGSWQKCVAACESSLKKGLSVVIDNTNPDMESRKRYTDCAKKGNVKCRCLVFNITLEQARHNEKFRSLTPAGKNHAKVNDMVFNSYKKKYEEPKLQEGFSEIAKVNFLPSFSNSKEEKLYKLFLLEK